MLTKISMPLVGAFALLVTMGDACAQASLIAENIVDAVSVSVKTPDGSTEKQTYTLVRDARISEQWYYFPNQPRLAETVIDGARVPELSFIRYTSSTSDGQLKSAGLLTFAVTLAAPVEAIDALKMSLADALKQRGALVPSQIRLSAIPVNSATAAVFSPTNGQLLAEGGANSIITAQDGAAPTNVGNKIVFALMLTDVGADIYKALLDGTGGVPVWIRYKFNGLTPPAGFKVTANWDQAYEHYSKNEQFRARASYYGWFSANYASDRAYIRDELLKSSAIKVEAITGGTFTQETLDNYLQPIVKRLNDTILKDLTPPQKIDPAKASTPGSGGFFGGVGYSVAVKDVKDIKKGIETWDFSISAIQERGGSADGSVGLQRYPKETRGRLVTSIDAGNWDRVYMALPGAESLDRAELRARLRAGSKIIAERYFRFTERTGWLNVQGNQSAAGFWVSLLSYPDFDRKTAAWETQYQFSLGDFSVSTTTKIPLEADSGVLFAPQDLVQVLTVSGDGLSFQGSEAPSKLMSVDVVLREGTRVARRTFKKETAAGVSSITPDLKWITPSFIDGKPAAVSAQIVANLAGGGVCKFDFDAEAFRARFPANNLQLRTLAIESCQ